jgi:hypothetical protein
MALLLVLFHISESRILLTLDTYRAAIARAVLAAVASVAGRATAVAVVDRGEDGGLHCVEEVGV